LGEIFEYSISRDGVHGAIRTHKTKHKYITALAYVQTKGEMIKHTKQEEEEEARQNRRT
jgi:hypothetical protein